MEYINLKFTKKGVTHHYAVSIFPPDALIIPGELYVYKDRGDYTIKGCSPDNKWEVNKNTTNYKWRYCYKIDQVIETDNNGYADFYVCTDKKCKNLYIYRTDQNQIPQYDQAKGIFVPKMIQSPHGVLTFPKCKVVPFTDDVFLEVHRDEIKPGELYLCHCNALDWIKLSK